MGCCVPPTVDRFCMSDRVFITGGSRGIGKECVRYFSKAGYTVAFCYKSSDADAAELEKNYRAKAIKADISNPDGARRAVSEALEYLGGIDILINNAGISKHTLFDTITDEEWRYMIDSNLSSAFYISREVSKTMISQKYGRIINIGSVWGRCGASLEVHYSASKAALRGLTLGLAKELGPSGITVNCIEPGVIDTDMNACLSETDIECLVNETPVERIGRPFDVARVAEFLSKRESDFLTGQMIGVDGGFGL